MTLSNSLKSFSISFFILILLTSVAQASQSAMVQAERAVIYADEQMTSPLGFVRKGKKVMVGSIARNKGQVYPIIISGKRGWIRVVDLSTEKESANATSLTAERFSRKTTKRDDISTTYSLSVLQFSSQIALDKENGELANNDSLNWTGVSLRGEAWVSQNWDISILLNLLTAKSGDEEFRMFEVGGGAGYKLYQGSKLTLRLDGHGLLVPFSTYALGDRFRKRGYGFTLGAGLNLGYRLGDHWGVEGYGGIYYTKLSGFDSPPPYQPINPSFTGNRVGVGITYQM